MITLVVLLSILIFIAVFYICLSTCVYGVYYREYRALHKYLTNQGLPARVPTKWSAVGYWKFTADIGWGKKEYTLLRQNAQFWSFLDERQCILLGTKADPVSYFLWSRHIQSVLNAIYLLDTLADPDER